MRKNFFGIFRLWIAEFVWILRCAQYDKFGLFSKFDSLPRFYFVKARNDGAFCHFERSEKSIQISYLTIYYLHFYRKF